MTMVKARGNPWIRRTRARCRLRACAEITHTISVPSSVSISPAQYT